MQQHVLLYQWRIRIALLTLVAKQPTILGIVGNLNKQNKTNKIKQTIENEEHKHQTMKRNSLFCWSYVTRRGHPLTGACFAIARCLTHTRKPC